LAGAVPTQILPVETPLNPLAGTAWWPPGSAESLHQFGQLLGGTCRFTLLSIALWMVLKIYRENGLPGHGRPAGGDPLAAWRSPTGRWIPCCCYC